jgi:hypothetical protein
MTTSLDARVLYDIHDGVTTLYLGSVASVGAATSALRSAADEVHRSGGSNMRVEFRRGDKVVYEARVRGDGAACS